MSLPAVIALALGLSLTAYAVLAGADFGAGALELLAGKRSSDHEAIAATIGPLWEANHVWLIFSITILFSAFPAAFAALGTGLLAPFTVALLAIVLRSAALGLRSNPGAQARSQLVLGRLFGWASIVAPFAFGTVAGGLAVASVRSVPIGSGAPAIPWTGLFAVLVGALAVAICAQLASTFVSLNLYRSGEDLITERFRRLRADAERRCASHLSCDDARAVAPPDRRRPTGLDHRVARHGALAAGARRALVRSRSRPDDARRSRRALGLVRSAGAPVDRNAPDDSHGSGNPSCSDRHRDLDRDRAAARAPRDLSAVRPLWATGDRGNRMKT